MKKRPVQKTLWDCGVYEKEDEDPFRNVTVGLSDDEDDDEETEGDSPMDVVTMVDEITDIVAEMEI